MSFRLNKGAYCGDISALCLIPCPWPSALPLLLAGSGAQIFLYDLATGKLLQSVCCFDGVRVHGMGALGACKAVEPLQGVGIVAVHGEGRVKVFKLGGQGQLRLLHTLPRFNHWVLDVLFLQETRLVVGKSMAHDELEGSLLAIGLSDNSLSLWDVKLSVLLCQVESTERCLLYSMRLWGKSVDTLRVAAGTIYNEVLIWKLELDAFHDEVDGSSVLESVRFSTMEKCVRPIQRLLGHEGSIYRLSWSEDGTWIVSVSDDRSARIWKHADSGDKVSILGDGEVVMGAVLYGHGGRLWDCHAAQELVITASEDCTCRVWDPEGKLLTTLKGHKGRGIWRCAYDRGTSALITAGADSAIRVASLSSWAAESTKLKAQDLRRSIRISSVPSGNRSSGASNYIDSKSEYVRCISLAGPTSLYVATNHGFLHHVEFSDMVTEKWTTFTQGCMEGPIVCMDVLLHEIDKGGSDGDLPCHLIAVGNGQGKASVLKVHPGVGPVVARCFSWCAETERKLLGIFWCKSLGRRHVFIADPRGGLRVWFVIDPSDESSSAPETSQLRTSAQNSSRDGQSASLCAVFQSPLGSQVLCLDVCQQGQVLVLGDKRGNVMVASFPTSLHRFRNQGLESPQDLAVLAVLKGAHGISCVTRISMVHAGSSPDMEMVSTGRDGCICKFVFERERCGGLRGLVCTGVERVPAITVIDSITELSDVGSKVQGRRLVAGFTAGDFILWDLERQYELLRVACGGWRRPFSYHIRSVSGQCHLAFVKDHAIHVHQSCHSLPPPTGNEDAQLGSEAAPQWLHLQFHGKEIHSVQFIPGAACPSTLSWVATGAEDGSIRLTRFDPGHDQQLDMSLVLGEHAGGSAVRALTMVSESFRVDDDKVPACKDAHLDHKTSLLVSVGAKEAMTCWILQRSSEGSSMSEGIHDTSPSIVVSRWLSSYRPPRPWSAPVVVTEDNRRSLSTTTTPGFQVDVEDHHPSRTSLRQDDSSNDDLRYMAVTAFSTCSSNGLNLTFVVTASSDSTLTVQAFCMSSRSWLKVATLDYHTSPVLALDHLVLEATGMVTGAASPTFLVFSGGTDGCIAVWDITSVVVGTVRQSSQIGLCPSAALRPPSGRGSQGGRRKKLLHYNNMISKEGAVKSAGGNPGVDTKKVEGEIQAKQDTGPRPEVVAVQPMHVIVGAHMSGVNCISIQRQKNLPSWVLVSGGDDEALHLVSFSIELFQQDQMRLIHSTGQEVGAEVARQSCKFVIINQKSVASAHYSAIKGIWTDGKFVFSTGLDQRLRCWALHHSKASPATSSLTECAHSIIDVPEAAALDVEPAADGSHYRIAVVGRGMQLLSFRSAQGQMCSRRRLSRPGEHGEGGRRDLAGEEEATSVWR